VDENIMTKRILVTGGTGMVGSALRELLPEAIYLSSKDGDLRDQKITNDIFEKLQPEIVIHLAGKVGGVKANLTYLGDFFYDNIMINTNVLEACKKFKVEKALSMLSTCVYPDDTTYPLMEEQIHNGMPHHTNYAYACAKRMLDIQSRAYRDQYGSNFITVIPNNLFGINDNFDLDNSHVLPAIIRKIYEGKRFNKDVVLWGDGTPLREFTYSCDMAKIILFLIKEYDDREPINVGNTKEYSIKEVAEIIASIYDYKEPIIWDTLKPPGQFRKPSSNEKLLELGWSSDNYTDIHISLKKVCDWFAKEYKHTRGVK
jgi:GDP-L-fucose synthase